MNLSFKMNWALEEMRELFCRHYRCSHILSIKKSIPSYDSAQNFPRDNKDDINLKITKEANILESLSHASHWASHCLIQISTLISIKTH